MTLDPVLMHKIDLLIDGTRFTNRSETAEFLLKLGIGQFRPERTALILCGGLEFGCPSEFLLHTQAAVTDRLSTPS